MMRNSRIAVAPSRRRPYGAAVAVALAAWCLAAAACCLAQGAGSGPGSSPSTASPDDLIKKVRLEQKLNAQVPLDITFRDETGKLVPLRQYFGAKPMMMNLIQYRCQMLCSQEMKVLAQSLKEMKFNIGDQFKVLTVSIDPREQPYLATDYKSGYLQQYGRPGAAAGWHFLTGDEASIRRLADAIGYHFVYDTRTNQFAHPDGVIVLTPQGKVARYFFRLNYAPRDLGFALIEASRNRIGSLLDGWALRCYHYDPLTGKYSIAFMEIVRLAGLATVLLIGAGVTALSLRGRITSSSTRSVGGGAKRGAGPRDHIITSSSEQG
jgi:protein SCO1